MSSFFAHGHCVMYDCINILEQLFMCRDANGLLADLLSLASTMHNLPDPPCLSDKVFVREPVHVASI